ncbi:universal stress protein [Amycolatopsis benzoatilytica]|uniref:universal stress protein n=1 Tax=Amycolatopsis benzoatilytica TaxID=346045 RepID=UPI00037478BC|nr:universal stress protein [Amycolatopsis benzoatilytica]
MRTVLAVQHQEPAVPVAEVAGAIADLLHSSVSTIDYFGAEPVVAVLAELARPDIVLGVVGRDASAGSQAWRVAAGAAKPVVVVPPAFSPGPAAPLSRVLVPLDGTEESAAAVADTMRLFAGAGLEVIVLHVFDKTTVPAFWDQAAHARRSWETEFRARFCAPVDARIELRNGTPGEHVARVAADEQVDLIALGWSQRLDEGRARTVRSTVRESTVPVMLVPLASERESRCEPGRS